MRVAFIYNGAENLGIQHLSSYLKARGHSTSLYFDSSPFRGDSFLNIRSLASLNTLDRRIIDGICKERPDVLALSSFTGNFRWLLSLAAVIKERTGIRVVFGGIHPSAVPDKVLKHDCVDYVVVGDGEEAMTELLAHIESGA